MNIPSLPTDNLYKFMAIFGLILFSLGIYLDYSSFGMYTEQRIQYSNELNKAYIESKFLREYSESLLQEMEDFYEIVKENNNINYDKAKEKQAAYNVRRQVVIDGLKQMEILIGEYEKSKEITDLVSAKKKNVDILSAFLQKVGGVFVFLGFLLWYFLHQRYMDAERRWKGMIYADKLKKREQQEKEKKETEPKSESENQEPEPDTESKSDS